ncbi:MAG: ribosome small subunit-dependent GTPase A [archaeon]|nr:ribosome small subunit-dependent GTPase A [archaeon]
MQGKIINITNKFVIVEDNDTKQIVRCSLKGKFKKDKINFLVGDNVIFNLTNNDEEGLVEELLERKNSLIRPPVSNVDQVILVFASKNPDISYEILDTFLAVIENEDIEIVLVINKFDLDEEGSKLIKEKYEKIGYKVILSSAKQNIGISEIKDVLKDKISVFAGPSGVGKSSILNEVLEDADLEVGDISDKTLRGKHTTKGTVLLTLKSGGRVFDTAGFTTIDLLNIDDENLEFCFKEFLPYLGMCKFTGCKHDKEIGCEIKKQVEEGNISKERYDMFIDFQNKLKNRANHREKDNKIYKGKKVFISSKEANKRGLNN